MFLFFLFISGIFWLLMSLNETFEKEVVIPLRMTNIPKNVVVINDISPTLKVTLRDKGYTIGGYLYGDILRPIIIDFTDYANGKGFGSVSMSDIQKQIYQQLYKSTKIVSVKMTGQVIPANSYYLSKITYSPDSIDVYASKDLLDSISTIYTKRQFITGLSDTLSIKAPLRPIRGAKFVPDHITMTLVPDVLTEETVDVPIEAINLPEGKVLRTFPSKVTVKFVVGANQLRSMPKNMETRAILPVGFRIVADYNSITMEKQDKCKIYLQSIPRGVRNAHAALDEVDYLIEAR